jgi:hypothetical protein
METCVPYEGHFASKQGRSSPLWSFARTGFILAVCTPLAIAPVPAAAQYYNNLGTEGRNYGGSHPSGGSGVGPGVVGGILGGIVGGIILNKVIQDYNANNPPHVRRPPPPPDRRHPIIAGPRRHPPVNQAEAKPVRPSKPPNNEKAPPPRKEPPRVAKAIVPPPQRPGSGVPPKDEQTRSCSNSARAFRRKRSTRSRGGNGCNGSRHKASS